MFFIKENNIHSNIVYYFNILYIIKNDSTNFSQYFKNILRDTINFFSKYFIIKSNIYNSSVIFLHYKIFHSILKIFYEIQLFFFLNISS